jgi:hypothetical protein
MRRARYDEQAALLTAGWELKVPLDAALHMHAWCAAQNPFVMRPPA